MLLLFVGLFLVLVCLGAILTTWIVDAGNSANCWTVSNPW